MTTSKSTPKVGIAHIITHKPTGNKTICVSRKQTAVRLQQIAKGLGQSDVTYIDENLIPLIASGRLKFDADDVMSSLSIEIQDERTVNQFVAAVMEYHKITLAAPTENTDSTDGSNLTEDSDSTDSTEIPDSTDSSEFLMAPDSTCIHLKTSEQQERDEWIWDSGSPRDSKRRITDEEFDRLFFEE